MRRTIIALVVAAALALTAGSVLWARGVQTQHQAMMQDHAGMQHGTTGSAKAGHEGGHAGMTCPMMSDLKETLKLTDTQARQVKDIQTKTMAAMQPYHEKMAGQEQAIAQAMKADKVDAAAVKQLVAEAGATMTACRQTMVDGQLALKGVLTPEQYGRLPECSMHASMMGGMAHGVAVQTPAAGETGTDHSQHHK